MRVYLLGQDGVGWSIDRDREHTARALADSGHTLVRTPLRADVVYCVWWNLLESPRWRPLRLRRVAAVVTNDLAYQQESFTRVRGLVDVWVTANSGQRRWLEAHGVPAAAIRDCPFYVEEGPFALRHGSRDELARHAGVDPAQVAGRFLIGSFQRDSLGSDLASPKWQKDPDLLLDVVQGIGRDDVLLVLAGPRRHYLLAECRRRSIPYLFVGQEPEPGSEADDLDVNTLSTQRIGALWNLIDLYVVPSKAEGGPKALLEAGLTETGIASTRVGMAPDLVPDQFLFETAAEGAEVARRRIAGEDGDAFAAFVARVREVNSFEAFRRRVDDAVAATGSAGR